MASTSVSKGFNRWAVAGVEISEVRESVVSFSINGGKGSGVRVSCEALVERRCEFSVVVSTVKPSGLPSCVWEAMACGVGMWCNGWTCNYNGYSICDDSGFEVLLGRNSRTPKDISRAVRLPLQGEGR